MNATSRRPRIQFAHGLESSPQGNKARLLAEHFDARTPAMNTQDFESCVALHADTIMTFEPDLLIGSSFGGAVAVTLLERGFWTGPTLLLAQAARHYNPDARIPEKRRVTIVHARQDDIVSINDSRALARTGTNGLVALIEVNDDHQLSRFTSSGELVTLIKRLL